jgi:magnesium chelatase accessory protein
MALDGLPLPGGVIGLNAALLPFPGPLGPWAPLMAQTLFFNPIALGLFSFRAAMPGAIADLIASTGSSLDARGLEFYERLFRKRGHLEGAIGLMAHWDLTALKEALPKLRTPLTLIVGDKDKALPPSAAYSVQTLVRHAKVVTTHGGHLVHEEAPDAVAALILGALQQNG